MGGKKQYGHRDHGSLRTRRVRDAKGTSADEDDGWLTIAHAREGSTEEEARHSKLVSALQSVDAAAAIAGVEDSIAATIVEYASEDSRAADSNDAWAAIVEEVFEDAAVPLKDEGDDSDDEDSGRTLRAADVVDAMRRCGVLCSRAPPLPDPRRGDAVYAVLAEDDEWHPATVDEVDEADRSSLVVLFLEWPKRQRTARASVVLLASLADDEGGGLDGGGGGGDGDGACELCGRTSLPLTFHHLVPKSTHDKYAKKACCCPGLPEGSTPSKAFLRSYGARLCRPCHSVVHRLAPNSVLAARYNTVDALRAAPAVAKWTEYAASR